MRITDGSNHKGILLLFLSLWLFTDIIETEAISDTKNGAMIVGEVVSPQGPVPYQKISLKRHEGRLLSEVSNTFTDAVGRYKFENLPLNTSFILELRYNGTRHFKALTTTSPIVRIDFNLIGVLTVKVVHVNDTAVEGILIHLEGPPGVILTNGTTGKNGVVGFDHLDLNETYRVSFTFHGVPYYEDFRFRSVPSTLINFTVYEATTSDKDIKINLHHVFVKLEDEYLSILENIIYRNGGVMVFNNSWLKASLPKGRIDLVTSIMDCCLQQFEDSILFDPMNPIKPGDRFQVWMEYKIKVSSSDILFKRRVDYDTDSFYLFFEGEAGIGVRSVSGLISKGTVSIDDINYNLLVGSNLEAGAYINVELSGLASSQEFGWQIMIGTILLAIPAGYYMTSILAKTKREISIENLEAKKSALFEKIAKLESDYNAGNIPKEEYETLKSKYKRRAIEVIRQIDKFKDAHMQPSIPSYQATERSNLLRDLYAEEKALTSTLEKLKADFSKGTVSKEAYEKIKAKFEDRRIIVKKKIKKLEKQASKSKGKV